MLPLQSKLASNSESNSYSFGGNIGFNNSSSSQDRLWTDNVASIIGTNSVTINTENNTDIKGGVVANITNFTPSSSLALGRGSQELVDGNNLVINTKTLTYSNLQDHNKSESNAIGINVGLPVGFGVTPGGLVMVADIKNTTLGLSYAANSSNQSGETKATIGNGTINLNSTITRDSTTGEVTNITGQETLAENDSRISNLNRDIQTNQVVNKTHYEGGYNIDLNISVAVLSRAYELHQDGLLADEAKKNLGGTAKLYGDATRTIREVAEDKLGPLGTVLTAPTQVVEGTIFTFLEDGSYAYKKTDDLSKALGISDSQKGNNFDLKVDLPSFSNSSTTYAESSTSNSSLDNFVSNQFSRFSNLYYYQQVDDVSTTKGYGLNGIKTDLSIGFANYLLYNDDVTYRYNPTHGIFGDLMESGIGKVADWIGQEDWIAMNKVAAQDIYDRRNVEGAVNLYHSQGTIIGDGAMELYSKTFQLGFDLNGNVLTNADGKALGGQTVNNTQKFYAVGPAVLEVDWYSSVTGLTGMTIKDNARYKHDNLDSILYLAAPSNLINDIGYIATLGQSNFNSPIYIPNPVSTVAGAATLPFIEHHDVKNESYSAPLTGLNQTESRDPLTQTINQFLPQPLISGSNVQINNN